MKGSRGASDASLVGIVSQRKGYGDSLWEEQDCTPAGRAGVTVLAEGRMRMDTESRYDGRHWSMVKDAFPAERLGGGSHWEEQSRCMVYRR